MGDMAIELRTPGVAELDQVLSPLREWQRDGSPLQLHPGDVGWLWRLGADATAAALRTWSRDGEVLAIGMGDGPDLVRLGIAPQADQDQELAGALLADLADPARGVLPAGVAYVETPPGALAHDLLGAAGWGTDEPWALLRRDLMEPVQDPGVRIEAIGPDQARAWVAVHRSAFGATHVSEDALLQRWKATADGLPYADGRSLIAYDAADNAVASVIVWSAGPGRHGLIEPLGVHQDHRGQGHGRAITLAAADGLRQMGASAVIVITPGGNSAAVAAYRSAGFELVGERRDRSRGLS